MKKLFLLIIGLTAFSCAASAQATKYTSVIAIDTMYHIDNNYPCPVANVDLNFSIAAVKIDATTTAFCLIDHSYFESTPLPITPVIPPSITAYAAVHMHYNTLEDFTVNDICVSGIYAFFCGTVNGTQSFYGYINLNDFNMQFGGGISGTSVAINIYYLYGATTTAPATLNKLVAYYFENKYKVVAIGNEDIDQEIGVSKIVEINDATGQPTCDVADMPYFNVGGVTKKIVLDDIVQTTYYVSVLGHDLGAVGVCCSLPDMRYPWISFGKKTNVIADICDMTLNPNYYLNLGWEAYNAVIGAAMPDDQIAITYVSPIKKQIFSKLRVIIIPGMINAMSQLIASDTKADPVDMCYMYDLMKVELLHSKANPSDYFQFDPYAALNYSSKILNPNNHTFKSLDIIRYARGQFISTRNAEVYIQDRTALLPHSTASCPTNDSINVDIIENLPLQQYACKIISGENELLQYPIFPVYSSIISIPLKTRCFSYE